MLIYNEEYILYKQKHYYTYRLKRHTAKEHKMVAIEATKELQKIAYDARYNYNYVLRL